MQQTQRLEHTTSFARTWRSAGAFAIGGIMVLAGILVLVIVPGEMWATGIAWAIGAGLSLLLLKAGLTLLLFNVLARFSAGGNRDFGADLAEDERKGRPAAGERIPQSIPETR